MSECKRISAIVTTYFSNSHADLIVSKFVRGFPAEDGLIEPQVDVVSMYMDQVHWSDVGLELARRHNIEVYPSIRAALTLTPPSTGHWPTAPDWQVGELAVDGVLIIAEHGDYAGNERYRQMYPRRYFFEQVCGIMAVSRRSVPVFSDKHLAYNWTDAMWMYERAQKLDVPLMAGSALAVAGTNPHLEHNGTQIEEALSIGYFHSYVNGLDSYGFHGLEALQCMVERRSGGETGIAAVQCLEGNTAWEARDADMWSGELAEAAEALVKAKKPGCMEDNCETPVVFLLEYTDGLRAATLLLPGHLQGWGYAARVDGQIVSTRFDNDLFPDQLFSNQALNIQQMFLTGEPQYPVERTLLVTGALDALMESRIQGWTRVETPHLSVVYKAPERPPIRAGCL